MEQMEPNGSDDENPDDFMPVNAGLEQRIFQHKDKEVRLLLKQQANGQRCGQAQWYIWSVEDLFWRSQREKKAKIRNMSDDIGRSHQMLWPHMQVLGPMDSHESATSRVKVLAHTIPTSYVFALAHHLFTSPMRRLEDKRIIDQFLRQWAPRMANEVVTILQYSGDARWYRYRNIEVDHDGCLPGVWNEDYMATIALAAWLHFTFWGATKKAK